MNYTYTKIKSVTTTVKSGPEEGEFNLCVSVGKEHD